MLIIKKITIESDNNNSYHQMNSNNNRQKAPALAAARTLAATAGSSSPQTATRNQIIFSRQQQQQTPLTATTTTRSGARSNAYSNINNNNKVYRSCSKNNASTISSQHSQQQQQSNPSFVTATTASQLPLNAPTSLANLAQLDGITLLPISNLNSISTREQQQQYSSSSNLNPNVSFQSNQSTDSPIGSGAGSAKNSGNNCRQRQQRPNQQTGHGSMQQLPTKLNIANCNNNQDKINYNLANIPSIQMLNQTSSGEPIQGSWKNLTALAGQPKHGFGQMAKSSAQLQSSSSLSNTNNRSSSVQQIRGRAPNNNNHRVKSTSNISTNLNSHQSINDIQVIPVTETLPIFSDMSEMQIPLQSGNSSFDDIILSQPSLKSVVDSDDSCVYVNGDMNNISLIKLMAILNNPALTVTAVDSKPSSNNSKPPRRFPTASPNIADDHHQQITPASLNLIDSKQSSISLPASNVDNSHDSFRNNSYITARDQSLPTLDVALAKNRVPQSTANLHFIDGSVMANCSSTPSKRHNQAAAAASLRNLNSIIAGKESSSDSFHQSNSSISHRQSDSHVNAWLSNLNSGGSKISSLNQSSSWSNVSNIDEGDSYQNEKLNDPTMLSTSVRNLMMQQLPTGTKQKTVSVQLLKHIANQTKDNDNWTPSLAASQKSDQKSILEPECILSVPRSVQQFSQRAKRVESSQTVTTSLVSKKKPKQPIQSTTHRLYVSRPEDNQPASKRRKIVSEPNFGLNEINVDGGDEREVHISEQHLMLESMMSNETGGEKRRTAMSEPDDIFINRSKRIMSRIDTIIERKKRRRFERISGRAEPKTNSLEEQCAESEDEWSGDDENMNTDYSCFIKTQLPLHEIETEEKKNHLLSVGLVSRNERNKLSVEHYEKKLKVFSPLAFEEPLGVPQDIQRLVDTLLKTGGTDIQLRIDSSIKRNDLPLIEGLNRNTSRMKMTYMSALGLEKRSKRTTLYKVKNGENIGAMSKAVDLNKIPKSATPFEPKQRMVEPEAPVQMTVDRSTGNNSAISAAKITSAKLMSCRQAMKPPSKNEYMKSLGLIAS